MNNSKVSLTINPNNQVEKVNGQARFQSDSNTPKGQSETIPHSTAENRELKTKPSSAPPAFNPHSIKGWIEQQQRDRTARAESVYDFLQALGYSEGDEIYFRALLPKHLSDGAALRLNLKFKSADGQLIPNTRRGTIRMGDRTGQGWALSHVRKDKEPKSYTDGLSKLAQWNKEGRGIYFVVNPGGELDSQIAEARCLFWEADDLSLEDQQAIADRFELDTESGLCAIVRTKKSLHCYVRLDKAIGPDESSERQHQLIEFCESDPAIFNPARLMRLPGFDHISVEGDERLGTAQKLVFTPVTLEHVDTETRTTEAQLDGILGPLTEPVEQAKAKQRRTATGKEYRAAEKREARQQAASGKGSAAPSNPQENPWDVRNFAHYAKGFDGGANSEWYKCQCPAHTADNPAAHSKDSLHINKATGGYRCHSGCDSKEIYAALCAIAREQGYQFGSKSYEAQNKKKLSKTAWKEQQKARRDRAAYERIAALLGSVADGWEAATLPEMEGAAKRARDFFYPLLRVATGYDLGGEISEGFVGDISERIGSDERALIAYDASKGTGKSNNAIIPAALRAARAQQRTLVIVPTRGLAREFQGRINGRWGGATAIAATHQDISRDYAHIVVSCPESLYLFKGQKFEHLIFDEANEDLQRLQSGELGKAGPQSLKTAHQLMGTARTVTLATANMMSWTVQAAQRMGRFSMTQTHTARVQRPKTGMGIVEYANFWQWLDSVVCAVASGDRISIPCGSQGKARMIGRVLDAKFPDKRGFVIDGKTTLHSLRSRFLAGPDDFLSEHKPSWLIFTPVINSGVSIEEGHFDAQFEYVTPHESAQSASQRAERVRSAIGRDGAMRARHIYFSTQGAPTVENYPDALDWQYWADELANTAAAPMGAAAALAKAIGAEKALTPLKQDAVALAAMRPELPNFMAANAFDVLFKHELLRDEWAGYGWAIEPAPQLMPDEHEELAALKLFAEDISIGIERQQGRILKKARGAAALDTEEIAGPWQAARAAKGKLENSLGRAFLVGQGAEFYTAWAVDKSAANPGIRAVVRSQLLKFAVETPELFAELEQAKALKFLAGKPDSTKGEFWDLPELPAPARDIELISLLCRCPGIAEVQRGELASWTNASEKVVAAALYLIAHAKAIAANTKRSGLQRGAIFSEQMAPAALFNKALELCGLKAAKDSRQGKGQRLNEYRLCTGADAEAALAALRVQLGTDEPPTPMQIFRAELAAIRAKTRGAVDAAAHSVALGKLVCWLDAEGQKASAIVALRKRHADLINKSVSNLGDGAAMGDGGGDFAPSLLTYREGRAAKMPPLAET